MRVLATGHNGYIGSVIVPFFQRAGHDVVGLDLDLFVPCVLGDPPPEIPSLTKDGRDVTAENFAVCDAVAHLTGALRRGRHPV